MLRIQQSTVACIRKKLEWASSGFGVGEQGEKGEDGGKMVKGV